MQTCRATVTDKITENTMSVEVIDSNDPLDIANELYREYPQLRKYLKKYFIHVDKLKINRMTGSIATRRDIYNVNNGRKRAILFMTVILEQKRYNPDHRYFQGIYYLEKLCELYGLISYRAEKVLWRGEETYAHRHFINAEMTDKQLKEYHRLQKGVIEINCK